MKRSTTIRPNCFAIPTGIVRSFVVLFFLTLSSGAFAQLKEKIDSLHTAYVQAEADSAKCDILTQIAEEYRFINSDSSIAYVNKAKEIAQTLQSDYMDVDIAILNAIVLYEKGDYENSIRLLKEIDPLATKLGDKGYLLKMYQTYGNSYGLSNDHRQAIEYELKALDYAKELKDSMAMANLYINIGSDFHYIKEYAKGIEYCGNARQIYEKLGQDFYQGFALNNMSNYSNHLNDYQKALDYATEATKYWNEDNNERLMGYLYHNFGEAYKGLKNYSQSEKYYQKSIAIRQKNEDPKDRIITSNELAELYIAWNKLPNAYAIAEANYHLAKEKDFTREEQQSAELLATIYEKQGNLTQAVKYLKISQQLKDSLQTQEQAKEVLRLETKYETAEKENLILQQRAKITDHQLALKNRSLWIFGLVALAVIIGLIGFLLYKQQILKNIKQQKDHELKLALEKIESQNKLQEQRLSISRDLHDNIGAQLSFIVSAIDTIKYYITGNNDQLTNRLDNIGTFAKETIRELRDTIWAMNRPSISIADLKLRTANFIESANKATTHTTLSFADKVENDKDLLFNSKTGMNIYRILQEAVNNALKHAEATRISISFARQGDTLQMQVEDNGKGFDTLEMYEGNGLQNMRNRAEALGGTLHITSEKGHTRVIFRFPLQEMSDKQNDTAT